MNLMIDRPPENLPMPEPAFVGMEVCRPGHTFGPAIRDVTLLHFVLAGQGTFSSPRGTFRVGAGQFFVILPGEVTCYSADREDPWEYLWFAFDERGAGRMATLAPVLPSPPGIPLRLRELCESGITGRELYLSVLDELYYHLFSLGKEQTRLKERVRRYIDYSYMEPLTVENIAQTMGFDRRYLSRVFARGYGMTVKEYLTSVRLSHAEKLLVAGYSVGDVAAMTGYRDVFNFSRIFKKKNGLSPLAYREKNRSLTTQSSS